MGEVKGGNECSRSLASTIKVDDNRNVNAGNVGLWLCTHRKQLQFGGANN